MNRSTRGSTKRTRTWGAENGRGSLTRVPWVQDLLLVRHSEGSFHVLVTHHLTSPCIPILQMGGSLPMLFPFPELPGSVPSYATTLLGFFGPASFFLGHQFSPLINRGGRESQKVPLSPDT